MTNTIFTRILIAILICSVVIGFTISPAAAYSPKMVDILIGFDRQVGSTEKGIISEVGGAIHRTFRIAPVISAIVPESILSLLREMPRVRYIEPNYRVHALNEPTQTIPWGIERVFGSEDYPFPTWDSSIGEGTTVAVLDTGIDRNHDDLTVFGGTNTVDDTDWWYDGHGHGTHVAGTIAALDNTLGVVGGAPQVKLYAVKVLDENGSGTVASIIAGIEWAVDENIRVLNMSLGSHISSRALEEACDAAYAAGSLLVAAAGNSGLGLGLANNVGYPARYDSVIAVAASDSNNKLASFSSTGPAVELIAPGVSILSTTPDDSYSTYSGTSMASPHVAGVAALAWAADLGMTNKEIRIILKQTAQDFGLSSNHQGYGLVRADLAVDAVLAPRGTIQGRVENESGRAIAGATVVAEGTIFETITDANGQYLLEGIPVGSYDVTASASGYLSETATVIVVEDGTANKYFVLEKQSWWDRIRNIFF